MNLTKQTTTSPALTTISPCCATTVDVHSAMNAMMVCPECKQIIKAFSQESTYKNYLKFCQSRSRQHTTGIHANLWLVIFHPQHM